MTIPFGRLSFPQMYEQSLVVPLFRPWAEMTLSELRPAPGHRILDVACGTGIVARLAKATVGQGGTVVGVDTSAPMLAVAREAAADVDWREGDAMALPLRDQEQFDVVVCQQGLQFFPDRAAAAAEMRRALAPGGRLAVSTWRPDEEIPFGHALRRIAERRVGPIVDRRHAFGETGPLEALLREAGFRDVRSKIVSRTIRFENGAVFVRLNAMALVGMAAGARPMADAERQQFVEEITRDSAEVLERHSDGRGLAFEMRSNVATALR